MLRWSDKSDEKTINQAVWKIVKSAKLMQMQHNNNNDDQDHTSKRRLFNHIQLSKLAQLVMPGPAMSRLVLVVIRHTTLLVSYLLLAALAPLPQMVFGSGANFTNALSIAINMLIYMLYPVGDRTHAIWCNCITKCMFFNWYDSYTSKKTSRVDEITIKLLKKYDQLVNSSEENSLILEIIEQDKKLSARRSTQTSDDLTNHSSWIGHVTDNREKLELEFTNLSSLAPKFQVS